MKQILPIALLTSLVAAQSIAGVIRCGGTTQAQLPIRQHTSWVWGGSTPHPGTADFSDNQTFNSFTVPMGKIFVAVRGAGSVALATGGTTSFGLNPANPTNAPDVTNNVVFRTFYEGDVITAGTQAFCSGYILSE